MLGENVLSNPILISAKSVIKAVISCRSKYHLCLSLMSSAGQPEHSWVREVSCSAQCCSIDTATGWTHSRCKPVTDWGRLPCCFGCKHVPPCACFTGKCKYLSFIWVLLPLGPNDCFFNLTCKSLLIC